MRATSAAGSVVTSDGGSSAPGIGVLRSACHRRCSPGFDRRARCGRAGLEGRQVGVDRLCRGADGGTIGVVTERQDARTGHGAQQHGTHECAGLLGDGRHVEPDVRLGAALDFAGESVCVSASVAERRLFADRVDAVRRCDQRGSIRSHEAALRGTGRLERLGGHDDVDVARARHQRHHRAPPVAGQRGLREELQVVEGCAGALRHTGHRGRLDEMAFTASDVDQPVRDDTATLPAQRCDHERHWSPLQVHRSSGRPASQPITRARRRASQRSRRVGFVITSAR